ncbi:MAG: hypothetical protein WD603_03515 [Patescibacteria group bacterium]
MRFIDKFAEGVVKQLEKPFDRFLFAYLVPLASVALIIFQITEGYPITAWSLLMPSLGVLLGLLCLYRWLKRVGVHT